MSVICRMRVGMVEKLQPELCKITLSAVYSPEGYEDDKTFDEIRSFFKYTPGANLEMHTSNPDAFDQFQVNDEFYVRLERIPTDQMISALVAAKHKKASDDA